jgi:quaternary ammonium compound-resistance protein SugE
MHWIYLVIAAVFESAWVYSVKFMSVSKIRTLRFHNFYRTEYAVHLLPLLGYIIFGVFNVYFFALAVKFIPTTTAFAVWTGTSLIFIKLFDVFYFHERISFMESFFLLMTVAGILGLKFCSESK